jgi:hypothetical protein
MECSGISAGWCPNCGDCCCPVNSAGEPVDAEELRWLKDPDLCALARNSWDCPLHSPASVHGERVVFSTIWGQVDIDD